MNTLKSGPVLGALAFVLTLVGFYLFSQRTSSTKEYLLSFNNPQKIENPDLLAYTLDQINGPANNLTFRCNPTTGEGYFSLQSENLVWSSSHCQDMVGAVKDIEEKKKPNAVVNLTVVDKQVSYRVVRNQAPAPAND